MKLTLRLPDDLYEALKHAAQQEHRSLNGQIVAMLSWLARPLGAPTPEPPDTHQADTTPPVEMYEKRLLVAQPTKVPTETTVTPSEESVFISPSLDAQGIPPDSVKGKATIRPSPKPPCTCGPGERAKGKHTNWCQATGGEED